MLLAMLPARLPPERALPAKLDAWLNLSHREKARVFIIVRISAIAAASLATIPISRPSPGHCFSLGSIAWMFPAELTNKWQPQELQPHQRQYRHQNP